MILPPPSYPTINPITICADTNQPGTWTINKGLSSSDIQTQQATCSAAKSSHGATIRPSSTPTPQLNINLPGPPEGVYDAATQCRNTVLKDFNILNTYCRKPDMSMIDPAFLMQGCTDGQFEMECMQSTNNYALKESTRCENGLYFCNGELSCNQCSFDRLAFEKELHKSHLNNFCDQAVSQFKENPDIYDGDFDLLAKVKTCKETGVFYGRTPDHVFASYVNRSRAKPDDKISGVGSQFYTPAAGGNKYNSAGLTGHGGRLKKIDVSQDLMCGINGGGGLLCKLVGDVAGGGGEAPPSTSTTERPRGFFGFLGNRRSSSTTPAVGVVGFTPGWMQYGKSGSSYAKYKHVSLMHGKEACVIKDDGKIQYTKDVWPDDYKLKNIEWVDVPGPEPSGTVDILDAHDGRMCAVTSGKKLYCGNVNASLPNWTQKADDAAKFVALYKQKACLIDAEDNIKCTHDVRAPEPTWTDVSSASNYKWGSVSVNDNYMCATTKQDGGSAFTEAPEAKWTLRFYPVSSNSLLFYEIKSDNYDGNWNMTIDGVVANETVASNGKKISNGWEMRSPMVAIIWLQRGVSFTLEQIQGDSKVQLLKHGSAVFEGVSGSHINVNFDTIRIIDSRVTVEDRTAREDNYIYCAPFATNNWWQIPGHLNHVSLDDRKLVGVNRWDEIWSKDYIG